MSRTVRCRRCGVLHTPERFAPLDRLFRLGPRCRGPLPSTGGTAAPGVRSFRGLILPEAA